MEKDCKQLSEVMVVLLRGILRHGGRVGRKKKRQIGRKGDEQTVNNGCTLFLNF